MARTPKMYHFPSRKKVDRLMPQCFRVLYPSTRIIIDCREFFVQRPSSLTSCQSASFSSYKNHNTDKLLLSISPDGSVTFVSDLYEGSITDRDIVEQSGLPNLLEEGDSVMADKGFTIQDLLAKRGVKLNIPPFRTTACRQMAPEDVSSTQKIAAVRIHVERAMKRLKDFRLLQGTIENALWDLFSEIIFVAAMLCNWQPGLCP